MHKPKKHPVTSATGRLGVNLIERVVTEMGHAWNEATVDVGIDGAIELCRPDTREALNRVILVQSKATQNPFPKETDSSFEWPCKPRDIEHWVSGNVPVILVISRAGPGGSEAYWVDTKEYFADPSSRRSGRVLFDKHRDRFNASCADRLMELGAPVNDGLYIAPGPRSEVLLSNLLPVASYPASVHVAHAEFRTEPHLWAHFKRERQEPGSEWVLWDKHIYSFVDLNTDAFRAVCDEGTVEEIESSHFALSTHRDLTNLFVRLLRKALRQKLWRLGVRFDSSERHYHFLANKELRGYSYAYRGRQKATDREVFTPYFDKRDPERVAYYRHSAFTGRFLRYGATWYLEITPTYRYTSDGYRVHPKAPDYVKKMKELELNDAVSGQVIMWASVLKDPPDLLRTSYPHLSFGDLISLEIDVGVDDKSWHPAEATPRGESAEGDESELSLFGEDSDEG